MIHLISKPGMHCMLSHHSLNYDFIAGFCKECCKMREVLEKSTENSSTSGYIYIYKPEVNNTEDQVRSCCSSSINHYLYMCLQLCLISMSEKSTRSLRLESSYSLFTE